MAYFDSPKNRALWEVELSRLRREKELRSRGLSSGPIQLRGAMETEAAENPMRIRTSYDELVEEARLEHLAARNERVARALSYEKDNAKEMPVRSRSTEKELP